MASGSPAILARNAKNFVCGTASLLMQTPKMMATYSTIKNRGYEHAHEGYKMQAEVWENSYWKRHLCQHENMFVDKELGTEVTYRDLAAYSRWRFDMLRLVHVFGGSFFLTGGWAVALAWPFLMATDTYTPSTFACTAEQKKQWYEAQDLHRYRFCPSALHEFRWWFSAHVQMPESYFRNFDELFEKNDVKRNNVRCRSISVVAEQSVMFFRIRRNQARYLARAIGVPTWPLFTKICPQARLLQYWELIFNEDYMFYKQHIRLEDLTDEEVHDLAWRRFLAPHDKELTRSQIESRIKDYWGFLGPDFTKDGTVPNLFVTLSYVMGYYNDPAYLEGDIADLDLDDYAGLKEFGKDIFLRRLEFENGPLRDQVEAHTVKFLEERQKKMDEL